MLSFQAIKFLISLKQIKNPIIVDFYAENDTKVQITSENNLKSTFKYTNVVDDYSKVKSFNKYIYLYLLEEKYFSEEVGLITISHKGRHFFQIKFYTLLSILLKSFLIPIIVAIITAYLTTKYLS